MSGLLFHPYVNYPIKYENFDIGRELTQSPTIKVPDKPIDSSTITKEQVNFTNEYLTGESNLTVTGTVTQNLTTITEDVLLKALHSCIYYSGRTSGSVPDIVRVKLYVVRSGVEIYSITYKVPVFEFINETIQMNNFLLKKGDAINLEIYRSFTLGYWTASFNVNGVKV